MLLRTVCSVANVMLRIRSYEEGTIIRRGRRWRPRQAGPVARGAGHNHAECSKPMTPSILRDVEYVYPPCYSTGRGLKASDVRHESLLMLFHVQLVHRFSGAGG